MPRYVTIGTLKLKPNNRPTAEQIADQGAPGVAQQPGYESVMFFVDEARSEYGAVSIWASREDAEQADAILTPRFSEAFGDLLDGPISTHIFEIYEHKR